MDETGRGSCSVPAATSSVGVEGRAVCVGGGIFVGGRVDVTKPGVAVVGSALTRFKPQPAHKSAEIRMGNKYLWITNQL